MGSSQLGWLSFSIILMVTTLYTAENRDVLCFYWAWCNLTPAGYLNPRDGCGAALVALQDEGVSPAISSGMKRRLYLCQYWYLNAVALATTSGDAAMMAALHRMEARFGRVRRYETKHVY